MKKYKLDNIIIFKEIVETGSLSAAANKLDISVAQVSNRLSSLEKELNLSLLQRTTRRISMSNAGEKLYNKACSISDDLECIWDDLISCQDIPSGLLRISAHTSLGIGIISPFTQEFMQRYPDMQIELTLDDGPIELITTGFDIAIRSFLLEKGALIPNSNEHASQIYSLPYGYYATPNYLKKHGQPKIPVDLMKHTCMTVAKSAAFHHKKHTSHWIFSTHGQREVVKIKPILLSNNPNVLLQHILQDAGIGPQPYIPAQQHIKAGELLEVLPDYRAQHCETYAFYKSKKLLPRKAQLYIKELKTYCAQQLKNLKLSQDDSGAIN